MTDRELLEQAAKAAGYKIKVGTSGTIYPVSFSDDGIEIYRDEWNPLTDDGDALRLAVKLEIDIGFWLDHVSGDNCVSEESHFEDYGNNPYAATRRAIVRAAAEIGKDMK